MTKEEAGKKALEYLEGGLHTITVGFVGPDRRPYTKCMDVLCADAFGGIYLYAEDTEKVDLCLTDSPWVSLSGITGCALSYVRAVHFEGKMEKVDPKFTRELLSEDVHAAEHLHTQGRPISVYKITEGKGTYEDVNLGTEEIELKV